MWTEVTAFVIALLVGYGIGWSIVFMSFAFMATCLIAVCIAFYTVCVYVIQSFSKKFDFGWMKPSVCFHSPEITETREEKLERYRSSELCECSEPETWQEVHHGSIYEEDYKRWLDGYDPYDRPPNEKVPLSESGSLSEPTDEIDRMNAVRERAVRRAQHKWEVAMATGTGEEIDY